MYAVLVSGSRIPLFQCLTAHLSRSLSSFMCLHFRLVSYFQWGWGSQFGYFTLVYLIVQGLDANILVPLLFAEAVNLHPVAIVVATLFFGGIWGFWGVFFAIPLATLVKAVLNAWPKASHK